jgi:SAM-dependent methyltransferase
MVSDKYTRAPAAQGGTDDNAARTLWDHNYANRITSSWTEHPLVAQHVYQTMTGGAHSFWLNWVFDDFLKGGVERVLSVGCGNGAHEHHMARSGYATVIDAFDGSPVGIEHARQVARDEGLQCNFSVRTFEEFAAETGGKPYDLVLFTGSLHHVRDLEGMCRRVHELVSDTGHVVVNEYVGPRHNIYPRAQVDLINSILSTIPPEFKTAPDATVGVPTLQQVAARDPSEAIRANLIPAYLEIYFEALHEVNFGGAILHPIFDCLNSRRIMDGSEESNAIVRRLIALDKQLTIDDPALGRNFSFGVYAKAEII